MKALFDTNILIDYLNGVDAARKELARHADRYISLVTWMEVLAGVRSDEEQDVVEMFLRDFQVVDVTRRVAREAVDTPRLPDSERRVGPAVTLLPHVRRHGAPYGLGAGDALATAEGVEGLDLRFGQLDDRPHDIIISRHHITSRLRDRRHRDRRARLQHQGVVSDQQCTRRRRASSGAFAPRRSGRCGWGRATMRALCEEARR